MKFIPDTSDGLAGSISLSVMRLLKMQALTGGELAMLSVTASSSADDVRSVAA